MAVLATLGMIFGGGYLTFLTIVALIEQKWSWNPWPTSGKSSRSTKSSRWKSPWRLRSTPSHLVLERKPPAANSSQQGVKKVCSCYGCQYGLSCEYDRTAFGADCGDPRCCPPRVSYDPRYLEAREQSQASMQEAMERKLERERLEREAKERKYQEHIASLEKLPGAIRMFRTWRLLADGSLKAMTQDHIWKAGENVTLASGGNASSDSGFYGFSSLEELQCQEQDWWLKSQSGIPHEELGWVRPDYWYVCGTMLCYGHVKLSEKGGRAQKAVPEYIIEPAGADPDFGMLVVNAAEKYGMRIMDIADAECLNTGLIPWVKEDN